jgi:16S rRNA (uracil1498-N3)-methyltransferase
MPIDRFYVEGPLTPTITLKEAEFHHLRVIRIELGEPVEIVNGQGALAKAKLISLDKKSATLELSDIQNHPRPPYRLILAVPLMMTSKLELVAEKGTEL